MTLRTIVSAALLTLSGSLAPALADEVGPNQGRSVEVGFLTGVAYYTAAPDGYRVVVTLAQREAAPTVRFEGVLAAGQSVTLSAPREAGAPAEAIRIGRDGDIVTVSTNRSRAVLREAAVQD